MEYMEQLDDKPRPGPRRNLLQPIHDTRRTSLTVKNKLTNVRLYVNSNMPPGMNNAPLPHAPTVWSLHEDKIILGGLGHTDDLEWGPHEAGV